MGSPWGDDGDSSDGEEWESLIETPSSSLDMATDNRNNDSFDPTQTAPSSEDSQAQNEPLHNQQNVSSSRYTTTPEEAEKDVPFAGDVGGVLRALLPNQHHKATQEPALLSLPEPFSPTLSLNPDQRESFLSDGLHESSNNRESDTDVHMYGNGNKPNNGIKAFAADTVEPRRLNRSKSSSTNAAAASIELKNEGTEDGEWEDCDPSQTAITPNSSSNSVPERQQKLGALNRTPLQSKNGERHQAHSQTGINEASQQQEQQRQLNKFSVQDFIFRFFWQFSLDLFQDWYLRIFLATIGTGFSLQSALLVRELWAWIWFVLGPSVVLGGLIWFKGRAIVSWMERQRFVVKTVDVLRLMMLFAAWIPTLLEVRILFFLCSIHFHHASFIFRSLVSSVLWVAVGLSFQSRSSSFLRVPPRHTSLLCGVFLYGTALLVSFRSSTHSMLWLLAPLLSISGMLLLLHHDLKLGFRSQKATWNTLKQYPHHEKVVQLLVIKWVVEQWKTTKGSTDEISGQTTGIRSFSRFDSQDPQNVAPTSTDTAPDDRAAAASSGKLDPQPNGGVHSDENNADHNGLDIWRLVCHLDLDEQVQPFVASFKLSVQSFPPDRSVALWVALGTKTPALLVFLIYPSLVSMLLPLVFLEVFRIREWTQSYRATAELRDPGHEHNENCQKISGSTNDVLTFWREADPMVTLLCNENPVDETPPMLLQMWWNIEDSVPALEMGLSTARCVQTTVAVVDLKRNLQVVSKLGVEVQEYGWINGLELLVRDGVMGLLDNPSKSEYMEAARNSVQSSRRIVRNLSALSHDDPGIRLLWHSLWDYALGCWGWLRSASTSDQAVQQPETHNRNRPSDSPPQRLDIPMVPASIGEIDEVMFPTDTDTPRSVEASFPPDPHTLTFSGNIDGVDTARQTATAEDADTSMKEQDKLAWSMAAVGLAAVGAVAITSSQRSNNEQRLREAS